MLRGAGSLLLNFPPLASGGGITYLLKASFDGPDLAAGQVPASLGAPYVEVGTLTLEGTGLVNASIVGGELIMPGTTYWETGVRSPDTLPRAPGTTILVENAGHRGNSFSPVYNASADGSPREGLGGQSDRITDAIGLIVGSALSEGNQNALVLWDQGAGYWVKPPLGAWQLAWVGLHQTQAGVYARAHKGNFELRLRHFSVSIRPALDAEAKLPATRVDAPVSEDSYQGAADALHDLTVTAPNPLSGSAALKYRVTDAQNYWTAYFDNVGAFRADSVAAGTPTNRVNVAAVAVAAEARTIRALCDGTAHNYYTLAGTTWTKRGGTVTLSHQDTATAIVPEATDYTLGALRSWPRRSPIYAELDRT